MQWPHDPARGRPNSFHRTAAIAATAAILLTIPAAGSLAACNCRCVNGKATAVCSSSTDIRPLCQGVNCPLIPPVKSPLDARKPVDTVTPGCETKQVYDPVSRAYVWDKVCR